MIAKRIIISIWCGITIPIIYVLLMAATGFLAGGEFSEQYGELFFLPLALPAKLYSRYFEQNLKDIGGAFGAAAELGVFNIFGNIILYAVMTYIVLWLSNKTDVKKHFVNFIKLRGWKR